MVIETAPQAQVFSLRLPVLEDGRVHNFLAQTDSLEIVGKVYAQGGENVLHCHTNEDHAFVILQGEATFHDKDDNITMVKQHQGILLPKGTYYWFQSSGDVNLVMLRVAANLQPSTGDDRLGIDGRPLPGGSIENKSRPAVPVPGKFFGD